MCKGNPEFTPLADFAETVPLDRAIGRVPAEDIAAEEYVPDFDRSTADGYAVRAGDTFSCSNAIPAILPLAGETLMGEGAELSLFRKLAARCLRARTAWS